MTGCRDEVVEVGEVDGRRVALGVPGWSGVAVVHFLAAAWNLLTWGRAGDD